MDATTVAKWEGRFEQLADRMEPCFRRQDLSRQAIGYVQGLLGRIERKNSWQMSDLPSLDGRVSVPHRG